MTTEKKDYTRSVRLTQTVKDLVENHEGNGFNQKFDNMVMWCHMEKPRIDKEIADAKEELKKLQKRIDDSRKILYGIDNMKWNLQRSIETAESIAKGCGVDTEQKSPES